MSIINKMLQDLDARRSEKTPAEDFGAQIRAVPDRRKFKPVWLLAGGVGGLAVIGAGIAAWILTDAGPIGTATIRPAPVAGAVQPAPSAPVQVAAATPAPPPQAVPAAVPAAATSTAAPAAPATTGTTGTTGTSNTVPAAPGLSGATVVAATRLPVSDFSAIAGLKLATELNPARLIVAQAVPASRKPSEPAHLDDLKDQAVAERDAGRSRKTATEKLAGMEEGSPLVRAKAGSAATRQAAASQSMPPTSAPDAFASLGPNLHGKEFSPQQRTDNDYRKAVTLMQQGRLSDAIAMLEQVLQADSSHTAARQALVGVLVETRRLDEARARAREGLAIDPVQPGLAMILARLLLDKGEVKAAIETMQRAQSAAADRADYYAFLAALMQRDERHKEAADNYLQALQRAPQNGVWWMGLGISLQADNRQAEAKEAFGKAKMSGSLSAELTAFVDSRLKLLQRQ
jgi:MSHA biogenesis protein MshN